MSIILEKLYRFGWNNYPYIRLSLSLPERIYNSIMAKGFSAMFTFKLDKTKDGDYERGLRMCAKDAVQGCGLRKQTKDAN